MKFYVEVTYGQKAESGRFPAKGWKKPIEIMALDASMKNLRFYEVVII